MTYFAKIENGIVVNVIVASQEFVNSQSGEWVETCIDTSLGVNKKGGIALRKNYAGKGYTYDKISDSFIAPKPFDSWILNDEKGIYENPIPRPDIINAELMKWDEKTLKWIE